MYIQGVSLRSSKFFVYRSVPTSASLFTGHNIVWIMKECDLLVYVIICSNIYFSSLIVTQLNNKHVTV